MVPESQVSDDKIQDVILIYSSSRACLPQCLRLRQKQRVDHVDSTLVHSLWIVHNIFWLQEIWEQRIV